MAPQVIDDLADFHIHQRDRNHNALVFSIWHEGTEAERMALLGVLGPCSGAGPAIE